MQRLSEGMYDESEVVNEDNSRVTYKVGELTIGVGKDYRASVVSYKHMFYHGLSHYKGHVFGLRRNDKNEFVLAKINLKTHEMTVYPAHIDTSVTGLVGSSNSCHSSCGRWYYVLSSSVYAGDISGGVYRWDLEKIADLPRDPKDPENLGEPVYYPISRMSYHPKMKIGDKKVVVYSDWCYKLMAIIDLETGVVTHGDFPLEKRYDAVNPDTMQVTDKNEHVKDMKMHIGTDSEEADEQSLATVKRRLRVAARRRRKAEKAAAGEPGAKRRR